MFPEACNPLIGKILTLLKSALVGRVFVSKRPKRPKTVNTGKISLTGNIGGF